MSETTMGPDFLQALEIVTDLRVDAVGKNLVVLAVDNVLLPVQEPCRDLELGGVLDNGHNPLQLVRVELASTLVEVDISLLADQVGVSATNTLDLGQGVHDFTLAIDVGVEQTENVLELLVLFRNDERHVGPAWS